jgi:hypothetical protein
MILFGTNAASKAISNYFSTERPARCAKCVEQRDPVLPTLLPFFRSSSRWPMLAKIMNLPE